MLHRRMSSLVDLAKRLRRDLTKLQQRVTGTQPPPEKKSEEISGFFKKQWNQRRELLIAAAVGTACLIALATYLIFKRPGDVSRGGLFNEVTPELTRGVVDWPSYGLNDERTRFLPRKGMKPPFKQRWDYGTGTLMEFSPVLHDGTLYGINNDALAFAIDAKTGEEKWQRRIGELNASSPAYAYDRLYAVNLEPGQALALDPKTGKTIWERDLPGRSESSPVVADQKVVFGCETGEVFALDAATGKELWTREVDGAVKGGVALNDGIVYAGDYGGTLTAINLDDGSVKWESSASGGSFGRAGSFYSTPTVAFGRVYIGSKDSRMYSFEAATGDLVWSHSTGSEIYAGPAVADTIATPPSVYFGGLDGHVYALDAKTGDERWSKEAGGSVIGAGAVIGQIFYVSNLSKRATAGFSTKTGKRVFGVPHGAYNAAISDGKQLYINTYAGVAAYKRKPGGSQNKDEKRAGREAREKAREARKNAKDKKDKKG
jgi:outer membrane protein assembly factor BamB